MRGAALTQRSMVLMATSQDAILAIRHVVQEHGDESTRLGRPADQDAIKWFGHLLGWEWPPCYLEVLAKHDGVLVRDAIVFGFLKSIESFLILYPVWHRRDGFWPVASDGCGNYYALAMAQRDKAGECPVVFLEMITSAETPAYSADESYVDFVSSHMRRQCESVGCSGPRP